ncbi:hypothetical protein BU26DRAFT_5910 [Trematosphaeria pertusa]|uniref:Uncharacterized protein n=1 Tax=Trematosphaeria pertusa TaxID=390896 RepID=A0A6A6J2K1_9PLEO|nr:uncharacterized protein BU26DRAFT_5910 [Trematosphaeria pertusa]KAF2255683.1 hypothetical protein BU26DRAFT_5910 [Trematosphaeria pertusa]
MENCAARVQRQRRRRRTCAFASCGPSNWQLRAQRPGDWPLLRLPLLGRVAPSPVPRRPSNAVTCIVTRLQAIDCNFPSRSSTTRFMCDGQPPMRRLRCVQACGRMIQAISAVFLGRFWAIVDGSQDRVHQGRSILGEIAISLDTRRPPRLYCSRYNHSSFTASAPAKCCLLTADEIGRHRPSSA